jgi:GT2 family glycosyltransferase
VPYLQNEAPVIIGWPVSPPEKGTWVQQAWHTHWLHKNTAANADEIIEKDAFRLITTRNLLCTRQALEQISFDEALDTGEDTDFVFQAYTRGIKVLAVPTLNVTHHGEPATLREFFRQQLWHANRRSYRKILRQTGGKTGGNAPRFTLLFLAGLMLALAGLLVSFIAGTALFLLMLLPLILLVVGPAVLMAARARKPLQILPLSTLYAAYGLARTIDLLGLHRHKQSWKM